ncbi:MAG TPA: lasso peptide biosynthesis B2 protein [Stellaceae bacterium]|nr:lasso peptide biosynthesis B2 protein [Stellaceae bacterium]
MARLRSTRHRLRRLADIGRRQRALLIEAALWLLLARLALALVPFARLARRLGTFVPPSDPQVAERRLGGSDEHVRLAEEISWAVTRAARHVPYRAACLPQAMAARMMLKRRRVPSVLHFGAAMDAGHPLDTHAWLEAVGVEVTGFPASDFADIACFV